MSKSKQPRSFSEIISGRKQLSKLPLNKTVRTSKSSSSDESSSKRSLVKTKENPKKKKEE